MSFVNGYHRGDLDLREWPMTNRRARALAIVTLAAALPLLVLLVLRSGGDAPPGAARPVSGPAAAATTPAPT
ncbi:hypothetical protein C1I99_09945, partial [Micromonospora deserti]